jgi:hypothetical protein
MLIGFRESYPTRSETSYCCKSFKNSTVQDINVTWYNPSHFWAQFGVYVTSHHCKESNTPLPHSNNSNSQWSGSLAFNLTPLPKRITVSRLTIHCSELHSHVTDQVPSPHLPCTLRIQHTLLHSAYPAHFTALCVSSTLHA